MLERQETEAQRIELVTAMEEFHRSEGAAVIGEVKSQLPELNPFPLAAYPSTHGVHVEVDGVAADEAIVAVSAASHWSQASGLQSKLQGQWQLLHQTLMKS